jgi:AsmA protein
MRVLKFTAVVLVALIAAGVLVLVVGAPSGFLIDKINTQFAAETGYKLKVTGGATARFWPSPSIEVRDITLLNKDGSAPTNQLSAASARLDTTLASLLSGKPEITEFTLVRPVIRSPLIRRAGERKAATDTQANAPAAAPRQNPSVGRVVVKDATILFMRPDNKVENRIEHINLTAKLSEPDHRLTIQIDAKAGAQDLRVGIRSKGPIESREQSLPLEMTIEAPGLLQGTLKSTANVMAKGPLVKINDLEGTIGEDRFTGWASVDLTTKPRVNVDLDFKRLSIAEIAPDPEDSTQPSTIGKPWSDEKINLDDLNYVDAQLAFSATELNMSKLRLGPVYVEAALVNGVLDLALSNTGIYGGKGDGIFTLDVSEAVPRQTLHLNLDGVRALPLLSAVADFRELDGALTGKIDVKSSGASQREFMAGLGGTVDVVFQDGEIRNVNLAQMVRNLTKTTLNGWQKKRAEKTDLSELSALFKITAGSAKTENLKINGPLVRVNGAGTADISAKTLQFKLDTKLVMSIEGQGGPANPVGFGVPVMVEGSWEAPKIYPDMAGILDNPDAAYSKLNELGKGLFGKSSTGGDSFFKGLGDLFKSKDDNGKESTPPPAADKKNGTQETPAAGAKPGAPAQDAKGQDAKAQDTKPQDTKPQETKPQDTKADDTKPDDTQAKINSILKELFGK